MSDGAFGQDSMHYMYAMIFNIKLQVGAIFLVPQITVCTFLKSTGVARWCIRPPCTAKQASEARDDSFGERLLDYISGTENLWLFGYPPLFEIGVDCPCCCRLR